MSLENLDTETELKFLMNSIDDLPEDIRHSMLNGSHNDKIIERSHVYQNYLNCNDQSLLDSVISDLNEKGIPFGTIENQNILGKVVAAKELRFMYKPELCEYVITIKGEPEDYGYSCKQLETDPQYSDLVKDIYEKYINHSVNEVAKMYFKIEIQGKNRSMYVEMDIFENPNPDGINILVVNEIEGNRKQLDFILNSKEVPNWLGVNITSDASSLGLKSRQLAEVNYVKSLDLKVFEMIDSSTDEFKNFFINVLFNNRLFKE